MADPAETLRQALREQRRARFAYDTARLGESPPGETPEQRAERLQVFADAAEAADAEMARLRPEEPPLDGPGGPRAP